MDAEDGRVTQFLAGVPELLARYRDAPAPGPALSSTPPWTRAASACSKPSRVPSWKRALLVT